mmetsp:Transcript_2943/g.7191  ORF Transcript_2943/g.7191 Transcript_2943/m.7191 type:complete len:243 (+) Transcript_2943:693-1421(+)
MSVEALEQIHGGLVGGHVAGNDVDTVSEAFADGGDLLQGRQTGTVRGVNDQQWAVSVLDKAYGTLEVVRSDTDGGANVKVTVLVETELVLLVVILLDVRPHKHAVQLTLRVQHGQLLHVARAHDVERLRCGGAHGRMHQRVERLHELTEGRIFEAAHKVHLVAREHAHQPALLLAHDRKAGEGEAALADGRLHVREPLVRRKADGPIDHAAIVDLAAHPAHHVRLVLRVQVAVDHSDTTALG